MVEYLGSAAFSKAVQCYDLEEDRTVCIKIIKNSKDFFDQSIDEIKLLQARCAECWQTELESETSAAHDRTGQTGWWPHVALIVPQHLHLRLRASRSCHLHSAAQLLNTHDPLGQQPVLRLFDFFYHKEHLFIVCELLRDNLYEARACAVRPRLPQTTRTFYGGRRRQFVFPLPHA